jgi:hypothetical protein
MNSHVENQTTIFDLPDDIIHNHISKYLLEDKTINKIFHDQEDNELKYVLFGEIKKLITKTSITAFGLNWQHCNHTTYFPTYSYEQYYQAIRRFWRFGQKFPVLVDLIISDGQIKIMDSLMVKKDKAINMFENLTKQTNQPFEIKTKEFNKEIILPSFL